MPNDTPADWAPYPTATGSGRHRGAGRGSTTRRGVSRRITTAAGHTWTIAGPGPMVVSQPPVYAPALVAFVGGGGGPDWSVALTVGGVAAAGCAWFALGPGEPWHPGWGGWAALLRPREPQHRGEQRQREQDRERDEHHQYHQHQQDVRELPRAARSRPYRPPRSCTASQSRTSRSTSIRNNGAMRTSRQGHRALRRCAQSFTGGLRNASYRPPAAIAQHPYVATRNPAVPAAYLDHAAAHLAQQGGRVPGAGAPVVNERAGRLYGSPGPRSGQAGRRLGDAQRAARESARPRRATGSTPREASRPPCSRAAGHTDTRHADTGHAEWRAAGERRNPNAPRFANGGMPQAPGNPVPHQAFRLAMASASAGREQRSGGHRECTCSRDAVTRVDAAARTDGTSTPCSADRAPRGRTNALPPVRSAAVPHPEGVPTPQGAQPGSRNEAPRALPQPRLDSTAQIPQPRRAPISSRRPSMDNRNRNGRHLHRNRTPNSRNRRRIAKSRRPCEQVPSAGPAMHDMPRPQPQAPRMDPRPQPAPRMEPRPQPAPRMESRPSMPAPHMEPRPQPAPHVEAPHPSNPPPQGGHEAASPVSAANVKQNGPTGISRSGHFYARRDASRAPRLARSDRHRCGQRLMVAVADEREIGRLDLFQPLGRVDARLRVFRHALGNLEPRS